MTGLPVRVENVEEAAERIRPYVRRTPVLTADWLDQHFQAKLFFKSEHLQEAGAFKSRGACNAVFSLPEAEALRGVVTHSSGNHAAALARAAQLRGIPAYIVMPENSVPKKIEAVRSYGGTITFCPPTQADRERVASEVQEATGATFIHPYDDPRIIAGQATAARELLQEVEHLDLLVTPVGGGGLLAGTLIAAKAWTSPPQVWAAEPSGADDACRSWQAGRIIPQDNPQTIADGLRTSLGHLNFRIMQALLDDILCTNDATIRQLVELCYRRNGWVVEPSGIVPLAALWENQPPLAGKRIGVIFSGGNVDMSQFVTSP